MSVYQRFISYMYEYHGNTRHQNCGYARIDNRNQLLKLEIHMKISPQTTEEPIHIYGCFQKDGQLFGIEFGQHVPVLGMVNWRIQCDASDLAHTGIAFQDLEGLVLSDLSSIFYCSIWNDQSIRPVDLIPYPVQSAEEETAVYPDISENMTVSADSVKNETVPSLPEEKQEPSPDTTPEPDTTDILDTTSQPLAATQTDIPDAPAAQPETISHAKLEDIPHTPTLIDRILEQKFTDTTEKTAPAAAAVDTQTKKVPDFSTARWDRLTHRFPRETRFTDGDLKNCIRLAPGELPVLRREGFHIAGNRFILHCFQRNPHCLVGRIGDSEQYIFAIPGIYDNQERFMANMFGFPCFSSETPGEPLADGQKGYWYRALH